jgi:diguanylate cyclase (GGDEF)-like protein/PAS domain S-box-containing protein
MRSSLRTQLILLAVVAFSVHFLSQVIESFWALDALTGQVYANVERQLDQNQTQRLEEKGNIFFSLAELVIREQGLQFFLDDLSNFKRYGLYIQEVLVLDQELFPLRPDWQSNENFYIFRKDGVLKKLIEETISRGRRRFSLDSRNYFQEEGLPRVFGVFSILPEEGVILGVGTDYSLTRIENAAVQRISNELTWQFFTSSTLWNFILITAVILVVLIWIQKGFLQPLKAVQKAFSDMGDGNFPRSLDFGQSKELRMIADQFGQMALRLEKSIFESQSKERQYRNLIEHLPQGIFIKNNQSVYVSCNTAYARMLGRQVDEVVGKTDYDFFSDLRAKKYIEWDNQVFENGGTLQKDEETFENNQHLWFTTLKMPVKFGPSEEGVLGIKWDITNRKLRSQQMEALNKELEQKVQERTLALEEALSKLEQLTRLDPLTQIPNRRAFQELIIQEWSRHRRVDRQLALLMIDIDDFKAYNDNYGHTEGDQCLVRVAQALKRKVGRAGDHVCRYGGEEFAVLLPETDRQGALQVAEALRQSIEGLGLKHSFSQAAKVVTISVGASTMIPPEKEKPIQLVRLADKALYLAKDRGRNQSAFFSPDEENKGEYIEPEPEG